MIGWKVAGWAGAIVATLALYLPSSLLCYGVLKATNTHRDKKWHRAAREGLAPVGTGLVIAGVIAIFRLSGGGLFGAGIAGASAAILCLRRGSQLSACLGWGLPRRSWVICWCRDPCSRARSTDHSDARASCSKGASSPLTRWWLPDLQKADPLH